MTNKTLVILAAGIGSRFGKGIKQLTPVDDHGHLIIDYSIHDAIASGFNKIVFIIRHDIEADFRSVIGDRIEAIAAPLGVEIKYAFQELADIPWTVPAGRTKPWGTGHAVLCCKDLIDGPFAVINADDYYGKTGFQLASDFMEQHPDCYALVGYILENTLSDHGGVTRGICTVDKGKLCGIKETRDIRRTEKVIWAGEDILDPGALVSMNFWCYPRVFLSDLQFGFSDFHHNWKDPLKDEFLLPVFADDMLKRGFTFDVLFSSDHWFGVTYQEDRAGVVEQFRKLIDAGVYQVDLYGNLKP